MNKITYNDYSKELLDRVPELKKGETVTFELLANATLESILDDDTKVTKPVIPASQYIPNQDLIFDAGKKENIIIAYQLAPGTKDREPILGTLAFLAGTGGRITLTSDKKDLDKLRYLYLTNFNADSVNPDKSTPDGGCIFRVIKPALTAKQQREELNKALRASAIVEQATETEIRTMAQQFNLDSTRSEDEIAVDLLTIARNKPDLVIKKSADVQFKIATVVEDAKKAKVIKYDHEANAWRWSDTSEAIMSDFAGLPEDSLVRFIQDTEQGDKFYDKMVKALKAKAKK